MSCIPSLYDIFKVYGELLLIFRLEINNNTFDIICIPTFVSNEILIAFNSKSLSNLFSINIILYNISNEASDLCIIIVFISILSIGIKPKLPSNACGSNSLLQNNSFIDFKVYGELLLIYIKLIFNQFLYFL